jgi:hypothetical protein
MPRGPKASTVDTVEGERAALERMLHRRVSQALARRIRIPLCCAEKGATNLGVAEASGVSRPTMAPALLRAPAGRADGRAALRGAASFG